MQNKKHPKANLDNYSKLFVQLGLVLSLAIVYFLLESKTFDKDIVVYNDPGLKAEIDNTTLIEYETVKPKPKPVVQSPNIDVIKKKDNDDDTPESTIKIIDIDDPVEPQVKFVDVVDPGETIKEDVDFIAVEFAPKFPGCEGNKEELKNCFSKKIQKFVNKNFNPNIAEDLGLSSGVKRIYTLFKIDENGDVIDIQVRSTDRGLENEAERVIDLLPKMIPGKQGSHNVTVKYGLPIVFKVE